MHPDPPSLPAQWHERRRRTGGGSRAGGAAGTGTAGSGPGDAEEEEEAVDQRVAASRQQFKALAHALTSGGRGGGSPDPLPRPSTPGTRRSKLDLRMATAMHRARPESASPLASRAPG